MSDDVAAFWDPQARCAIADQDDAQAAHSAQRLLFDAGVHSNLPEQRQQPGARPHQSSAWSWRLGKGINPVDKGTATVLDTGKDGQHSDPSSPCYSCHQTLDPMRNVMLATWTYAGSQQLDRDTGSAAPRPLIS